MILSDVSGEDSRQHSSHEILPWNLASVQILTLWPIEHQVPDKTRRGRRSVHVRSYLPCGWLLFKYNVFCFRLTAFCVHFQYYILVHINAIFPCGRYISIQNLLGIGVVCLSGEFRGVIVFVIAQQFVCPISWMFKTCSLL